MARTAPTRRRDQILVEAARLFARHGFHGTSIDGIGAAAGVSGPAIYRHFPSKEGLLAEMLVGISEYLLDGARAIIAAHPDADDRLAALIDFQVDFALHRPELADALRRGDPVQDHAVIGDAVDAQPGGSPISNDERHAASPRSVGARTPPQRVPYMRSPASPRPGTM